MSNSCDPMDCNLPGSSVHGVLQARILEWVAIPFSRGSSQPRDQTWVSCIAGRSFTIWATREALSVKLILFLPSFLKTKWPYNVFYPTTLLITSMLSFHYCLIQLVFISIYILFLVSLIFSLFVCFFLWYCLKSSFSDNFHYP